MYLGGWLFVFSTGVITVKGIDLGAELMPKYEHKFDIARLFI